MSERKLPSERDPDGALMHPKEIALYRRAIRERWPISNERRQEIVEELSKVMRHTDKERSKMAAAATLIKADALNVAREKIEAQDEPSVVQHYHTLGLAADAARRKALEDRALIEQMEEVEDCEYVIEGQAGLDGTCDVEAEEPEPEEDADWEGVG